MAFTPFNPERKEEANQQAIAAITAFIAFIELERREHPHVVILDAGTGACARPRSSTHLQNKLQAQLPDVTCRITAVTNNEDEAASMAIAVAEATATATATATKSTITVVHQHLDATPDSAEQLFQKVPHPVDAIFLDSMSTFHTCLGILAALQPHMREQGCLVIVGSVPRNDGFVADPHLADHEMGRRLQRAVHAPTAFHATFGNSYVVWPLLQERLCQLTACDHDRMVYSGGILLPHKNSVFALHAVPTHVTALPRLSTREEDDHRRDDDEPTGAVVHVEEQLPLTPGQDVQYRMSPTSRWRRARVMQLLDEDAASSVLLRDTGYRFVLARDLVRPLGCRTSSEPPPTRKRKRACTVRTQSLTRGARVRVPWPSDVHRVARSMCLPEEAKRYDIYEATVTRVISDATCTLTFDDGTTWQGNLNDRFRSPSWSLVA